MVVKLDEDVHSVRTRGETHEDRVCSLPTCYIFLLARPHGLASERSYLVG
jgi:hypothetical protein